MSQKPHILGVPAAPVIALALSDNGRRAVVATGGKSDGLIIVYDLPPPEAPSEESIRRKRMGELTRWIARQDNAALRCQVTGRTEGAAVARKHAAAYRAALAELLAAASGATGEAPPRDHSEAQWQRAALIAPPQGEGQ